MNISHRAFQADIDADTEGRTITGVAVPYNTPTVIAERGLVFEEQFAPGAFDDSIAKRGDRIPILLMHDALSLPIGKPAFNTAGTGLGIDGRISDTQNGNDALTLARDGVLTGWSVGFSVAEGGDVWSTDMSKRMITKAKLHEVSLVNFPAYDDARVLAVREAERTTTEQRFQGTFSEIGGAVETALREHFALGDSYRSDIWVCDLSNFWAVFRTYGDLRIDWPGYWRVDYTIDNNGVATLVGEPEAVEPAYVPVAATPARFSHFDAEQRDSVAMLLELWSKKL